MFPNLWSGLKPERKPRKIRPVDSLSGLRLVESEAQEVENWLNQKRHRIMQQLKEETT